MSRAYRICFISVMLLSTAGCDQLTKRVAKSGLASSEPISLLGDAVILEYAENPGAFLSIGEGFPRPVLPLFSSLLATALILLLVKLVIQKREVEPLRLAGLSLIAGGSVGNLIDRLQNAGAVIDFISVGIGPVRTGIFNLADVAILTGVFVLLLMASNRSDKADAV